MLTGRSFPVSGGGSACQGRGSAYRGGGLCLPEGVCLPRGGSACQRGGRGGQPARGVCLPGRGPGGLPPRGICLQERGRGVCLPRGGLSARQGVGGLPARGGLPFQLCTTQCFFSTWGRVWVHHLSLSSGHRQMPFWQRPFLFISQCLYLHSISF